MVKPINDFYDVPVIGAWTARVGHVYDIISTPCEIEPTIAVLAAFHAAPRALVGILKPDRLDLVAKRFGRPHGRRLPRRFRVIDELIMKVPPPVKKLGWCIWKLGDWAQRLGWYMLIVDAGIEFAVHWTSAAYQWSGCNVPGAPYCRMTTIPNQIFGPGGDDILFMNWALVGKHIFSGDIDSIGTVEGFDCSVMIHLNASDPGLGLPRAGITNIKLYDEATDRILAEDDGYEGHDGRTYGTLVWRNWEVAQPHHNFQIYYSTSGGYMKLDGAGFAVYGNKNRGLMADP